ncbi:MAG: cytochrome c-type biogenesis protein CcmH [Myxococcota bacterium]
MAARLHALAILVGIVALARPAMGQEEHELKGAPSMELAARKLGVSMDRPEPGTTLEQANAADIVGRDVVCLCGTCPKRLISDCDCGWAKRNQVAILNAVAKGKSRAEIVAAYREVYGERVLAMLPDEGVNMLAWRLPYAGALLGLAVAFVIGRRFLAKKPEASPAGPTPTPAADAAAQAELKRELEDLDG